MLKNSMKRDRNLRSKDRKLEVIIKEKHPKHSYAHQFTELSSFLLNKIRKKKQQYVCFFSKGRLRL